MSENQIEEKKGWSRLSFFFTSYRYISCKNLQKGIIFGLFLSLVMTGCSDNTDLVKNGVMNFNKTITIGEAFNNWNNCEDSKWDSFKTDNHTKVVEFTCKKKNVKEYFSKVKNILIKQSQGYKKADYLNVVSSKEIFQWTINKDDTFQINNVQSETIWADGKKITNSVNTIRELKNVYNNSEISFDLSDLNPVSVEQLAYMLAASKATAK